MTATTTQAPKRNQRRALPAPTPSASPGARLLAVVIDILVGLVIGAIITLVAKSSLGLLLAAGAAAVGLILVRFVLIATTGWTPGGRIVGVRMVDASNDEPSFVGAFVHADLILITAGIGGLFMLRSAAKDPEGMGWHDRLSRMRLISTKASSAARLPRGAQEPSSGRPTPSASRARSTTWSDEPTAMMTPSAVPSVERLMGADGASAALAEPAPTTPSAVPSVPPSSMSKTLPASSVSSAPAAGSGAAAGAGSDSAPRTRRSIRRAQERLSSRADEPGAVAILGSIPWSGEAPELDSPTIGGSTLDELNASLLLGSVDLAPGGGSAGHVIDAATPESDSAPSQASAASASAPSAPSTSAASVPSATSAPAASAASAPGARTGSPAAPSTPRSTDTPGRASASSASSTPRTSSATSASSTGSAVTTASAASAPASSAPSASAASVPSAVSAPIAPRDEEDRELPPPTEPVDLRNVDLGQHSDDEDSLDSTVQSIRMPSSVEDTSASAVLVPERDGGEIALAGVVVLGRDPVASSEHPEASLLVLRGTSLSISKTHALLIPVVDGLWVTDLHSTNGTTIIHGGASRRAVPGIPEPVFPGDRVLFGKVGYRVKE